MSRDIKFRAWSYGIKRGSKWIFEPQMMYDEKLGDCLVWKSQGQNIEVMQWTGLKDIYESDIVKYNNGYHEVIGIVKLGEYEQDGSGGEYNGQKCLGFYVERVKIIPSAWDLEMKEVPTGHEYEQQISVMQYELEVIGNIHEHHHLLPKE